jgi:T5SS/PEP-CTERM-associated repeat protein/autotransporter-associated beta strand protein
MSKLFSRFPRRHALLAMAAGAVTITSARSAQADDFNWNTLFNSGDWSVPSNWHDFENPGLFSTPQSNGNAYINSGDSVTINNESEDVTALGLGYVFNNSGPQNSTSATLTLTNSTSQLFLAGLSASNGSNILVNGGLLDSTLNSGANSGFFGLSQGEIAIGVTGSAASMNVNSNGNVTFYSLAISNASNVTVDTGAQLQGNFAFNNNFQTYSTISVNSRGTLTVQNNSSINGPPDISIDTGGLLAVKLNANVQGDDLTVGGTAAGSMTIDNSSQVSMAGGSITNGGSVSVNGGQLTLTNSVSYNYSETFNPGELDVGVSGSAASLNVNSGGFLECDSLYISTFSTVTVNTNGEIQVDSNGNLQVGSGSLLVENGSQITLQGGDLQVGHNGNHTTTGSFTLQSGSRVQNGEIELRAGSVLMDGEGTFAQLTDFVGESGTLTLQNAAAMNDSSGVLTGSASATVNAATWTNSSLAVGYNIAGSGLTPSGNLSIQNGGQVLSAGAILEDFASTISVAGANAFGGGSSLVAQGNFYIGYSTLASLTIQTGGYVSDLNGFIGFQPASASTVTVSNAGSIWNNTQGLFVNANGSLTIQNSASVTAASGSAATATSVQILSGGSLTVSGAFANSSNINNAAFASFGSLTGAGTVTDSGTLTFTPAIIGSLTNTVSGTGAITMSGAGTLVISSANPSFTGTLNANNGITQLSNASALGSSVLNVGLAGTVDLNGNNLATTRLTGSGVVDNLTAGGSETLTVSSTNSGIFYGSIRNTTGTVSLTKSGTGTLTLAGNNTYSGTTTINASSALALNSTTALPVNGNIVNNGTLYVNADTTAGHETGTGTTIVGTDVRFVTDFSQSSLVNNGTTTIDGQSTIGQIIGNGNLVVGTNSHVTLTNTVVSTVGSVTIGTGSQINLTTGGLRINFGANADPVAMIKSYLTTGYNNGTWTGTGLTSSTAATGTPGETLSVGYSDGNNDVGTPAQPNQILVKYTLAGDSNLDGLVNFNDLVTVVQNFNKGGTDWAHGNFLYGASTNFNDLVAVVQNFNKILTPAGSSGDQFGAGGAIPLSAIVQSTSVQLPEPAALSILAAGAGGLLARRRRRKEWSA